MKNSTADRRLPLGLFPGQPTPRLYGRVVELFLSHVSGGITWPMGRAMGKRNAQGEQAPGGATEISTPIGAGTSTHRGTCMSPLPGLENLDDLLRLTLIRPQPGAGRSSQPGRRTVK